MSREDEAIVGAIVLVLLFSIIVCAVMISNQTRETRASLKALDAQIEAMRGEVRNWQPVAEDHPPIRIARRAEP